MALGILHIHTHIHIPVALLSGAGREAVGELADSSIKENKKLVQEIQEHLLESSAAPNSVYSWGYTQLHQGPPLRS
jgi:hypothetical protein